MSASDKKFSTGEEDDSKTSPKPNKLLERLAEGPIICAEGYVFEMERRGYMQIGTFVPIAVLEEPQAVKQLHRDFVRCGSDVIECFTYFVTLVTISSL